MLLLAMDLDLGRLATLFLKFPNHELFDKTIASNFCASLPALGGERLHISSKGCFNNKIVEEACDLIIRSFQ